jgi:hypothetical protein
MRKLSKSCTQTKCRREIRVYRLKATLGGGDGRTEVMLSRGSKRDPRLVRVVELSIATDYIRNEDWRTIFGTL